MGEEKGRQAFGLQFIQKNAGSSRVMVYVILVVLLLAAQIISPGYLKPIHVAGILRLASFMGIAAIGQNLTILTRGVGLFIADTTMFTNVIVAQIMMGRDGNLAATLLAVTVMGAMVGFINRVRIHWPKTPPFIITLDVGTVIQGVFLIYIRGAPKGNASPPLKAICGQSFIGILSGIVVIWAITAAVIIALLWNTPYGGKTYSVGTNKQAARFSEVHAGRMTPSAYLISTIIVAVSGFFLMRCTGISFLDVGISHNTETTTAVIIGGTAITGGKGGYIGAMAGAIIMTILDNFLTIINIPETGCQIMQGVITVLPVLIYSREKHRKQRSTQSEAVYGTVHEIVQEIGGIVHVERYN